MNATDIHQQDPRQKPGEGPTAATEVGAGMPRVGLLGVGLMGSAMADRLLSQGFGVIAWDAAPAHATPLVQRGARVVGSAGEVVSNADLVITMLPTAEIVLAVVEPLLAQWPKGAIWLQMSSVGAAESDGLGQAAAAHGVIFFDAPVSGSTRPAREGRLTILAGGPEFARSLVEPILAALGSRVQWVGDAGSGSRLKLAANHWMIAGVTALAEAMYLCELMGLDQQQFVTLLDEGPLGSPYGSEKLGEMTRHEYAPGFPVRLAVKDLNLVREVAESAEVELPVLNASLQRMTDAIADYGEADLAAVYEVTIAGRTTR